MIYDYYANEANQNALLLEEVVKAECEVDKAKGKEKDDRKEKAEDKRVDLLKSGDPHLSYHLLVLKDIQKDNLWDKNSAGSLRSTWARIGPREEERMQKWPGGEHLIYPACDLTLLPHYSFFFQFSFRLARPYISGGEHDFYIIDNPVCRDNILGLPYVAPSSWKGSLRAALWQKEHREEETRRIFGNERGEYKVFHRGRLHFYPTFFKKTSVEVINPHDRERRIGNMPIYFEAVPSGDEGLFSLLYVPFDRIGKEEAETRQQVATDLVLIAEGLYDMFTANGFGARTSSGYGSVNRDSCKGKIQINVTNMGKTDLHSPAIPEECFQKYLNTDGTLKKEFIGNGEGFLLSNKEYKKLENSCGGGSLSEFKKFKLWYLAHGHEWQAHLRVMGGTEAKCPTWSFTDLDNLVAKAKEIASEINREERP